MPTDKHRAPFILVLLAVASSSTAGGQQAHEVVKIGDAPACATCSVRAEHFSTLGGTEPRDGIFCHGRSSFVGTAARVFIGPGCADHELMAFDTNGAFLGSFGEPGEGPQEFGYIAPRYVDGSGRLYAYDESLSRVVTFAPDLSSFETSQVAHVPRAVLPLGDGTTVQNIRLVEGEQVGQPLHVVDGAGNVTRSFGSLLPVYRMGHEFLQWRALATAADGGVLAAHFNSYQVDRWDPATGRLEKVYQRTAEWFPKWETWEDMSGQFNAIRVDEHNRLWALLTVPTPDEIRPGEDRPESWHQGADTVLEVVDLDSGTLLATKWFDLIYGAWIGTRLATLRESGAGDLTLELWDVTLEEG